MGVLPKLRFHEAENSHRQDPPQSAQCPGGMGAPLPPHGLPTLIGCGPWEPLRAAEG